ncbi:hypothetical protein ACA910_019788 [Epithemia clementina (nom. ined.)]
MSKKNTRQACWMKTKSIASFESRVWFSLKHLDYLPNFKRKLVCWFLQLDQQVVLYHITEDPGLKRVIECSTNSFTGWQ